MNCCGNKQSHENSSLDGYEKERKPSWWIWIITLILIGMLVVGFVL